MSAEAYREKGKLSRWPSTAAPGRLNGGLGFMVTGCYLRTILIYAVPDQENRQGYNRCWNHEYDEYRRHCDAEHRQQHLGKCRNVGYVDSTPGKIEDIFDQILVTRLADDVVETTAPHEPAT